MRIVPARNGLAWLLRGWNLFRRNPGAWVMLMPRCIWLTPGWLPPQPSQARLSIHLALPLRQAERSSHESFNHPPLRGKHRH